MTLTDSASALAAVVSAVFGVLAVVAAFRSASYARKAHEAAEDAERRGALRQIVSTAKEAELEAQRVIDAAGRARRSRNDVAIAAGALGGSRNGLSLDSYASKGKRAEEIANEAKLFSVEPSKLEKAPGTELDRVVVKLGALLSEAQALRQDLERERTELEAQSATFRQAALHKALGQ